MAMYTRVGGGGGQHVFCFVSVFKVYEIRRTIAIQRCLLQCCVFVLENNTKYMRILGSAYVFSVSS